MIHLTLRINQSGFAIHHKSPKSLSLSLHRPKQLADLSYTSYPDYFIVG